MHIDDAYKAIMERIGELSDQLHAREKEEAAVIEAAKAWHQHYLTFDKGEIERIDKENAIDAARDAVIEAAKAWAAVGRISFVNEGAYKATLGVLREAVEALEAERGE
jgi:hypothetical protein